jgi:hypothetical protein
LIRDAIASYAFSVRFRASGCPCRPRWGARFLQSKGN